ncbi:hypothetical protein EGI16_08290 [Chryseobacterium sp. G0240]|nr:hypothetical protein EGI16_08290 [Chryseobacterium sp. G0240]
MLISSQSGVISSQSGWVRKNTISFSDTANIRRIYFSKNIKDKTDLFSSLIVLIVSYVGSSLKQKRFWLL